MLFSCQVSQFFNILLNADILVTQATGFSPHWHIFQHCVELLLLAFFWLLSFGLWQTTKFVTEFRKQKLLTNPAITFKGQNSLMSLSLFVQRNLTN